MNDMNIDEYEKFFTIDELLADRTLPLLTHAMSKMGLKDFELLDVERKIILSKGELNNRMSIALCPELEPVGFFDFNLADENLAESATVFILEILQTNWRYKMASSIHLQVSKDDFETLSKKNEQLLKSESKYKALSENLEKKVVFQVKLIEESQRQLYETEKMASIGQLASGVAHEINNPIGFISSNLNTAADYLEEVKSIIAPLQEKGLLHKVIKEFDEKEMQFLFSDFKELIQESLEGAKRVTTIVADLKEFSNVDHSEDVLADLAECAEKVVRILLTSVHHNVNIRKDIQAVEKTFCKLGHINQLLLNLLHNAVEAIAEKGDITLAVKCWKTKLA